MRMIFDIENLTEKKREILKGIFPNGGVYELNKSNPLISRKFDEQIN